MPVGLRNAERERLLGQMWKALPKAERSAHKANARAYATAPTMAPTMAAPLAFSGAGQTLRGAPGATSPSSVLSGAGSAAAVAIKREQASLDAAQARQPCHRIAHACSTRARSRIRFARRARAALAAPADANLAAPDGKPTTCCTHHLAAGRLLGEHDAHRA